LQPYVNCFDSAEENKDNTNRELLLNTNEMNADNENESTR